jgi:hypothetical protein
MLVDLANNSGGALDVYRNGSGYGTVDVNIAPSTVIAMINLTGTTG